jgi:hypothetical protein
MSGLARKLESPDDASQATLTTTIVVGGLVGQVVTEGSEK